ncbi:hypothetical protein LWI28_014425 [Acer negundo]|uniref:Uncharacterized protein n=1 Tax=Acer negundo TaxID=4023 RepID=A0AAD5IE68_ACENE|nr:hypothetical protein LWI28_014425 [Acer negundo]
MSIYPNKSNKNDFTIIIISSGETSDSYTEALVPSQDHPSSDKSSVFLDRASATSVGIRAVFVRDDIIMPPRRRPDQIPVDLAIERDRVIQLERQVEQLTAQLAESRANQNPFQALHPETSSDEVEGDPQPRRR